METKHRQQALIVKKENFKWINRKWNEGEITTLTELLEERECFHKTCFQKNLFSYFLHPRMKNLIINIFSTRGMKFRILFPRPLQARQNNTIDVLAICLIWGKMLAQISLLIIYIIAHEMPDVSRIEIWQLQLSNCQLQMKILALCLLCRCSLL